MKGRQLWLVSRMVLIAAVLTAATAGFGAISPGADTSVAEASPAQGKKDEKDGKRDKKEKQKDDDRGDDFVLNGQVLEMDVEKDPPELIVGTVDGRALVRVLKTDEIARNGVIVGDHVELTGEKINEQLFEATEISVAKRDAAPGGGSETSSDDDGGEDDGGEDDDGGDASDEP